MSGHYLAFYLNHGQLHFFFIRSRKAWLYFEKIQKNSKKVLTCGLIQSTYILCKVKQDLNKKGEVMIKSIIIALDLAYGFYKVRLERAKSYQPRATKQKNQARF